jgi:hypothetical protein
MKKLLASLVLILSIVSIATATTFGPDLSNTIRSVDGGWTISDPSGSAVQSKWTFDRTGVPIPHTLTREFV